MVKDAAKKALKAFVGKRGKNREISEETANRTVDSRYMSHHAVEMNGGVPPNQKYVTTQSFVFYLDCLWKHVFL